MVDHFVPVNIPIVFVDIHKADQCAEEYKEAGTNERKQENHEVSVVLNADAIVDPRTMVVESFNALIASVTMSRTWSSYYQAIWTQLYGIHELHKFLKIPTNN